MAGVGTGTSGNNEAEKEDGDAGRVVTGLVWVIRRTPSQHPPTLEQSSAEGRESCSSVGEECPI